MRKLLLATFALLLIASTELLAQTPMQLKYTTTAGNQSIELPIYQATNCVVNWGDGSTDTYTTIGYKTHEYTSGGTYTVEISGTLEYFGEGVVAGIEYLTDVISFGNLGLTSLNSAFQQANNLLSVPVELPATVTDLSSAFLQNTQTSFTNLNNWDVSNVTNMQNMFQMASNFNQDISTWNTSSVTNMSSMFSMTNNFNQDISNWNTSSVTTMDRMFISSGAFNQDLNNWNTSSVTDMSYMFNSASVFDGDISGWNTSSVINMSNMFSSNSFSHFNQDISSWNTSSVTDMRSMFYRNTDFNQDISSWNTSSVKHMSKMFQFAFNFDQNLSSWNISFVEDMIDMLDGVTLSTANYDALLIGWATQSVKQYMHFDAGYSKYSLGEATTARETLTGAPNYWAISDGGQNKTLTWDGSHSESWNDANNWDFVVVPTFQDNVIIPSAANYTNALNISGTGNSGASCNNFTVNNGATLTISGSLITYGSITNNGAVEMEQDYTYANQWFLISMPFSDITANTFLDMYLQQWNEPAGTWDDIIPTTTPLTPVKGYSYFATNYATSGKPTGYSISYTGTPNTGNQSLAITADGPGGSYNGANLLGNPYPSYLDWDAISGYGTKYTWNGTDYDEYTEAGTGSGGRYVDPMEGFFVVSGTAGTFSLNNNMRSHTASAKKSGNDKAMQNGIVLTASGNDYDDDLWLVFNEQASENFELQCDAWKLLSSNDSVPQLWSESPDGMLAIDCRPECETIQLGFANNISGFYSIGLKDIEGTSKAVLEDTKTGTFHDLTKSAYEFTWNITDDEMRFKLHLNAVGIEENQTCESNIRIYAADNQIFIKNDVEPDGRLALSVTDIMGRIVLQQTISASGLITIPINLKTGVYIVMVQNENNIKTEKVFIK